jgi:glyoxylase-like metal-dependent hydrolase (beta-lactamase superfamily II)
VFAAIRGLGRWPDELKHLIFTHCHPDHIGGAAAITHRRSPGTAPHATSRTRNWKASSRQFPLGDIISYAVHDRHRRLHRSYKRLSVNVEAFSTMAARLPRCSQR